MANDTQQPALEEIERQLAEARRGFDPGFEWSDDGRYVERQREKQKLIRELEAKLCRAAAPDLLAALKSCRSELWRLLDVKGVEPKAIRNWPEIAAADAAIAKATGGAAS